MDDLTTRLQKQAERGTYIPDGPELMRDVIAELAALSCKNSQLLSTNYDLHKERDRQIDEIEFLRSRLAAHEYIPTPEERRKQEVLAKEIAAEVIADETELKRLRLEIESLRSRLAEVKADMTRLLRNGIVNAPCPTPAEWRQLQDFARGYLAGSNSATHRETPVT